jgi:transcriptional regulator with XRE-family HTH domain
MESRKNSAILDGMSESWPSEITGRIAAEIKRLRGDRSGQWLSDQTEKLGHRVSRSTISEIETGRRKSITVADLIILAAALDTVPIALIYPGPYNETVRVLPTLRVAQIWGARWFSGELRTISEVPFDDKGHYIKVARPLEYDNNIRRLEKARRAAELYERKASMWRQLNQMQHTKSTGDGGVTDDEIRTAVDAIADYQREIDNLLEDKEDADQVAFEISLGLRPRAEGVGPDGG